MDEVLTQVEVEQQIQSYIDRLEASTLEFAGLIQDSANAEIAWKRKRDGLVVAYANRGLKGNDARASIAMQCSEEEALHLIADARVTSAREAMLSWRAVLNALQTLSANIRAST